MARSGRRTGRRSPLLTAAGILLVAVVVMAVVRALGRVRVRVYD